MLQDTVADFDSGATGEDNNQIIVDAISSQAKWLRDSTDCHFYVAGGVTEDDHDLVPTSATERGPEEGDIPSTPHPQHSTMLVADRGRYPHKTNGPYCRVPLEKNDAGTLLSLEVRDASGSFTDWVADDSKDEGADYRLYVEPGSAPSRSYVDLRAASLPSLRDYGNAVQATYEFGEDELPSTIRRATAMRAAAQLLASDDEATLGIPENANIQSVETKVQALERQAEELLEVYL
ncbi:hypothetical protein C484_00930 [Natrialba taiwanensis DSM 12281]|uniref:Uncharacterized protein n=1 Tax=Natrialba taiwanensis DSM 12281 TaxID=1230458 RepID=M0AGQ0_9EURY|nr:hypothetical protein C484_00930 [Natrialba taiwanensis DSM 12281]